MMDTNFLKNYAVQKAEEMISMVQKTNTDSPETLTYVVYKKKYELDGSTVVQLPDEVETVTEVELNARLVELQAEIDAITAFKADSTITK